MSVALKKYRKLVEKLHDTTEAGGLVWRHDESSRNYIETDLASRILSLEKTENMNGEPLYVVSIYEQGDKIIERFSDEDISVKPTEFYRGKTHYQLMSNIFEMGLRQASGADTALDDIIKELDGMVPF